MWASSAAIATQTTSLQPRTISVVQRAPECLTVRDHRGRDTHIVWMREKTSDGRTKAFPAFPFQVYVLDSANSTAESLDLPTTLLKWFEDQGALTALDSEAQCHFEIYTSGFQNVLSCVAHQRAEVKHRNLNALAPRLIECWTEPDNSDRVQGYILVIDRDSWADDGLLTVEFDRSSIGHMRGYVRCGKEIEIEAIRRKAVNQYGEELAGRWRCAGGLWKQKDLERRSNGGFSPALYPAIDPTAREEADSDLSQQAQIDLLPAPVVEARSVDEASRRRNPRYFNQGDLLTPTADLPCLAKEVYQDSSGRITESIWKVSISEQRPQFAVTLYVADDVPYYSPEALFHCLDRGLLQSTAWTLDVVRKITSINAALHHHSIEAYRRSASTRGQRVACVRTILDKVRCPPLPEEMIEHVEACMVPRAYVDFSCIPLRRFRHVFGYLGADHRFTGPKLVYFDPLEDEGILRIDNRHSLTETLEETCLVVSNVESWHLVADELHTSWSLCSPRARLAHNDQPVLSLELRLPQVCKVRPLLYGRHSVPQIRIIARLHSSRSIAIHQIGGFFPDIWSDALELSSMETGLVLPCAGKKMLSPELYRRCSWTEGAVEDGVDKWYTDLDIVHPGNAFPINWPDPASLQDWWMSKVQSGLLEDGKTYHLRLKAGLKVSRWTFGTAEELEGPFNLPPIPVMVEAGHEFTFRIEARGDDL